MESTGVPSLAGPSPTSSKGLRLWATDVQLEMQLGLNLSGS